MKSSIVMFGEKEIMTSRMLENMEAPYEYPIEAGRIETPPVISRKGWPKDCEWVRFYIGFSVETGEPDFNEVLTYVNTVYPIEAIRPNMTYRNQPGVTVDDYLIVLPILPIIEPPLHAEGGIVEGCDNIISEEGPELMLDSYNMGLLSKKGLYDAFGGWDTVTLDFKE